MPKKKKLSEEEVAAISLDMDLKRLKDRDQFIPNPPPHMIFKVGDRVQRGNIDKTIITEVLDGGRIYRVHENHLQNHYGNMIPTESDSYASWLDLSTWRNKEENAAIPQLSERDPLYLQYSNSSISSIFGKVYHFGLDMEPDYQRGNVWEEEDQVKLIDSVFNNVDIGKFVFIHLPYKDDSPSYEVLDGKQRIVALCKFYESRLKYKGLYYNDLCFRDQRHFEMFHTSAAEVRNEDVKLSDKYRYFLRLNTGGKLQDPAHLAKVRKLYEQAIKEGK